jgi:hypothetical protein
MYMIANARDEDLRPSTISTAIRKVSIEWGCCSSHISALPNRAEIEIRFGRGSTISNNILTVCIKGRIMQI